MVISQFFKKLILSAIPHLTHNSNPYGSVSSIHDELLTSFDGLCYMRPQNRMYKKLYMPHVDQSPYRNKFECVQGLVTLTDVTSKKDGGLIVYPKSHKIHKYLKDEFPLYVDRKDWFRMEKEQMHILKDSYGIKPYTVIANAGDLLLWDSRTIHQASLPRIRNKERIAIYVCMLPRSTATEAQLKKKVKAFNEKRTTSHWPNKCMLNPKNPTFKYTIGKPKFYSENVKCKISKIGKKLAGF